MLNFRWLHGRLAPTVDGMDENTTAHPPADETSDKSGLGGRLPLMAPAELSVDQRHLHGRLTATRVARADSSGYQASLDDGRLIGPFNAMLRTPGIGESQLDWAQAISAAGLPDGVREVAILTVATEWDATYVLYAHRIAARAAGLSDDDVAELTARRTPTGLSVEELLAHRLAVALVRDHNVQDELYAEIVDVVGEERLVALVELIGQYLATSAIVTCFRVPAPPDHT